ncbi:S-adenosyl-L-methionine-dependent methyltransferase [Powellomyces hirtus]|nr:S-adenosyl-L-methionine-dependent methyltransferase [Powellomyces hirtus]
MGCFRLISKLLPTRSSCRAFSQAVLLRDHNARPNIRVRNHRSASRPLEPSGQTYNAPRQAGGLDTPKGYSEREEASAIRTKRPSQPSISTSAQRQSGGLDAGNVDHQREETSPPQPKRPWTAPRKATRDKTPNDNLFPPDFRSVLRSLNLSSPIPYLTADPAAEAPYAYHEEVTVKVFATSDSGHGVGLGRDNWIILIPTVMEGETVKARVFRDGIGFSFAELVEVIEKSPHRVEAACKYFGRCGGCGFQHVEYEEQLRRKRAMVERVYKPLLETNGGVTVRPAIPSPIQYGYRTKMTPHYEQRRAWMPLTNIGFNERGRKTVLDIDDCPIVTKEIGSAYKRARGRLLGSTNPTNVLGATLMFRHSLPMSNRESDAPKKLEPLPPPIPWPPASSHPIAVEESRAIVRDSINGLNLSYPAFTFFQTNSSILPAFLTHIRTQLRSAITSYGLTTLIDTYCGAGIFALSCAPDFNRVVGIELDPQSLQAAKKNAADNNIANARFFTGSAERIFNFLDHDSVLPNPDHTAVIMDPPAKGSTPSFMDQLLRFNPKVILYVSCNVASQVRDLEPLLKGPEASSSTQPAPPNHLSQGTGKAHSELYIGGRRVDLVGDSKATIKPAKLYSIVNIQPFDMFPQTAQLENVVMLVRNDKFACYVN